MLLAALVLLSSAPADPAASLPAPVRRVFAKAAAECRMVGGKLGLAPRPAYVERVDLNDDGRVDYVLDREALVCDRTPSLFCGTAGCGLDVLVSGGAHYRSVFVEARAHRIERSTRTAHLRVTRAGSSCGWERWTSECDRLLRWDGRAFASR